MNEKDLLIITEIVSPYRIPVFNELSEMLDGRFHVIFLSDTDSRRHWNVYLDRIKFSYEIIPRIKVQVKQSNPYFLNLSIIKAIQAVNPKILVMGGYAQPSFIMALLAAKYFKIKCALWCESSKTDRRLGWSIIESYKQWFINQCNAFVVPGIASANYLADYGIKADKIFFAYNAVDTDFFTDQCTKQARELRSQNSWPENLVLYVGRLTKQKGIFDLIHAFAQLKIPNTGLLIVGDGPDRTAAEKLCESLGCENVFFTGFIQQDDLPGYYGISRAFVFPTYSDPWGLVLNEAMSCQIPAIASEVAGASQDLVEPGLTGYLFKPGNVEKLKYFLSEILQNPEHARELGKRGWEKIQAYKPKNCATGMLELRNFLLEVK